MSYGDFAEFLLRSFEVLRVEKLEAYGALVSGLEHDPIRFIDRDRQSTFLLHVDEGQLRVGSPRLTGALEITLSRQIVVELLNGTVSLEGAIRADRLVVRGGVRELARFFEILQTYVRAALRAPSMPALLDAYCASRRNEEAACAGFNF